MEDADEEFPRLAGFLRQRGFAREAANDAAAADGTWSNPATPKARENPASGDAESATLERVHRKLEEVT